MEKEVRTVIYTMPHNVKKLLKYADTKNYLPVKVIEFSDSCEKNQVENLKRFVEKHGIKTILINNYTSLSTNISEYLMIIQDFHQLGVSFHIYNDNLDTLLQNGVINPVISYVNNALFEFDSVQRQQLRRRLQKGYEEFNGRVGRKTGYRKNILNYQQEYAEELNLLRQGYTLRRCQSITGTSINTLRKLRIMFSC